MTEPVSFYRAYYNLKNKFGGNVMAVLNRFYGIIFIVPLLFLLVSLSCSSSPPPSFDEAEWLKKVKASDINSVYAPHVNPDGTFFNPWMDTPERKGRWRRKDHRPFDEFPEEKYAHVENDYSYLLDKTADSISFAGHASTIIKMNGETIFTDPFFSNYALVIGKELKLDFDFSKVPDRPVVLISHNHYDHLDKKTVKQMIKKNAVFLVPLKLKEFFVNLGAAEVHELDWWECVQVGSVNYTFLPAQHWSRRIWQKSGATLWGGWMVQGSKTVYFSGDSGYFRGFEEFGNRFNIDYALVGAGAYEPRWFMHYSHMNVDEFFRSADELKAKIAIPIHFGVINLSDESILYPFYEVDKYIEKNPEYSGRVRPLRVGEYLRMESPGQ
jgi:L-ascorbate metabolism protein UlaG (beta-lactamase superfamily)